MENKDFDTDFDHAFIKDMATLGLLEEEHEKCYEEIVSRIARRRRRRGILKFSASCAAVAIMAAVTIFLFDKDVADGATEIEEPVLITSEGEVVALGSGNGYTLEYPVAEAVVAKPADVEAEETVPDFEEQEPVQQSVKRNTVVIPQGFTYNIKFDDGTEAFLNSGSYIEYPQTFANKETRTVSLTGEGYFKVAGSPKPFVVDAAGVKVQVYGTEFNINTNNGKVVETLLVEGSVGVKADGCPDDVMLVPNQMHVYDLGLGTSEVKTVDPQDYLGWMRGDFTCSNQPLGHLLEELESHYGISIEADAAVKEKMIAINLSRKLGFRQIMEILEAAFGVDFQRTETGHYVCKNNL
ncbi:MAG: FecR domain-containing protein [Bacteroidales bacterium]|nr:FecR domain-containing protein [Bacteroidales bacterium]